MSMTKSQVLQWLENCHQTMNAQRDYLTQLDTDIGDGDHGGNMARGMAAVMTELDGKEFASADQIFKIVAMQLLSKVGGASGPLYGSAFMGLSKASQAGAELASMLQEGLDMIQKRGKAELGEKTMVDVWTPVISAIREDKLTSNLIQEIVQATADTLATKGRASYVGERSVGHIDPGSYSSGLLFESLLEVTGS